MARTSWVVAGVAVVLVALTGFGLHRVFAAEMVPVGAEAPGFTLPSQENTPVSLSEYKGQWVVLYFYPKDQTAGCTLEAHNFQRDLSKYEALHAVVLGVSLDTVDSHKAFCTKDTLTFKLLADPAHKVVDEYGVPVKSYGAMHYAARTTFLISPEGKIVKEWKVKDIQNHSSEVLAAIAAMKG